jgi:hypothetical protein
MQRDWWAPLTGVLFIALLIIGFAVGGDPPDADSAPDEIVDWYVDNKDSVELSSFLAAIGGAVLIFFVGYLRKVLRAAEGEGGMLSILTLIGAAIFVTGLAIDATVGFAIAEAADDVTPDGNVDPLSIQALEAFWDNDWLPFAVGIEVLILSSGLSIVRHGALPKWLGWVAILLAIVALTPIGFAAFIGTAIWILVVSVMLTLQARSGPSAPAPAAAPPA